MVSGGQQLGHRGHVRTALLVIVNGTYTTDTDTHG